MSHAANHGHELRRLLEALMSGDLGLEDALQRLRLLQVTQLGEFARLDVNRDLRKGVPEVIYAPRKREAELEMIVRRFLEERGVALVSRLEPERAERLRLALTAQTEGGGDTGTDTGDGGADSGAAGGAAGKAAAGDASAIRGPVRGLVFTYSRDAETLAAYTPDYRAPEPGGCVGLLTAGTSDIPVAEEAALVITHMGCRVERGYDTGVAGMHRLLEPLTRMIKSGADVLVVVAGMEGALPSVVAGLVDLPVVGVPTSTGYGLGGDGTAALYSILQSCSPGLVAVNIDNGVGAGAAAALIARRRRE
jgi:pyridinium-3,5-biscarboxylic acid mononucleotide synthase